jgi:hypothetical protein
MQKWHEFSGQLSAKERAWTKKNPLVENSGQGPDDSSIMSMRASVPINTLDAPMRKKHKGRIHSLKKESSRASDGSTGS